MLRRITLVIAIAAAAACSGKKGPVIAKGGGISITTEDLKKRIDEQSPMARQNMQTIERKKQFLENMIKFELLAKAAEKEGLDKDPEVQQTMKKVIVSKYYQRFFQDAASAQNITPEEVQQYYDSHKDEFHRPARIHLLHYFFQAPASGGDRAKKQALAKKTLAKILADEAKNPNAFATAAREGSEDAPTKALGGDLGYKTRDDLEKAKGKEVADAAFGIGNDNKTLDTVVEAPNGFYLLRVLQRQPEFNRTLDEAKMQISSKLANQRKTKEFEEFIKKLRDDAHIKIDEDALEKVVVSAPAGMPHGGPMQMPRPMMAPNGSQPPPPAPAIKH